MRSMWTGTVGFGPVVLPVRLGTAVSEDKSPLHQVRRSDGSRIRYKRIAEADGADVEFTDVVKGYEMPNGQIVKLEKTDFATAYGDKTHNARIVAFTTRDGIPRTASEKSYLVEPGKGGEVAYELLSEVLRRTGKVAVVSVAISDREALALLYTAGDGYLLLERLNWAAEVKAPDFAAPKTGITEEQIALAETLVGQMTKEFDWSAQADSSRAALEAVVAGKIENGEAVGVPSAATSVTAPANLTDILRASVAAAKAAKAPVPAARKPRTRKTAAAEAQVGEAA